MGRSCPRAGNPQGAPNPKTVSVETRKKAAQDSRRGEENPVTSEEGSTKRGKARLKAMKREPKSSVSRAALSRQAKSTARKRGQTVHRKSTRNRPLTSIERAAGLFATPSFALRKDTKDGVGLADKRVHGRVAMGWVGRLVGV